MHGQHKITTVRLTIIVVPFLTPTSKLGHLQKAIAIHACLLRPMHRILYCLSGPLGHPNIAQIIGAERTTLFHTLLTPKVGGDTLT
jgi:hypothetical protein